MSRKNSFIELSEKARAILQKETGMDDLDYHLAIFHGGEYYLDQLTKGKGITRQVSKLYREHLTMLGFWDFYSYLVKHVEIAIATEWNKEGSLIPLQSPEWKRERFITELRTVPWRSGVSAQLDIWLKDLGDRISMRIPATQPQEQHV